MVILSSLKTAGTASSTGSAPAVSSAVEIEAAKHTTAETAKHVGFTAAQKALIIAIAAGSITGGAVAFSSLQKKSDRAAASAGIRSQMEMSAPETSIRITTSYQALSQKCAGAFFMRILGKEAAHGRKN